MARFTLYNCDFGIKVNGQNYEFTDVAELQVEDPERNSITRGANGKNKVGLSFRTGVRDPKRWTIPILNLTIELKDLLDSLFESGDRVDVYAIDRQNGSSKMAKTAVLCNKPQQLSLTDQPDSLNVNLEFETFDSAETHKA